MIKPFFLRDVRIRRRCRLRIAHCKGDEQATVIHWIYLNMLGTLLQHTGALYNHQVSYVRCCLETQPMKLGAMPHTYLDRLYDRKWTIEIFSHVECAHRC